NIHDLNFIHMIQRIQSIYLFLASLVIFLIFLIPIAHMVTTDGQIYYMLYRGIDAYELPLNAGSVTAYPLAVLFSIILILLLISIFLYRNRIRQIRFCVYNILLMFGSGFLMWFYINQFSNKLECDVYYKLPIVFPLIAVVLTYLAFKRIKKDEELVRSADRIR
ncbi:DUF4293 domain-containing protein, partial [Bacteroidota bacterium]